MPPLYGQIPQRPSDTSPANYYSRPRGSACTLTPVARRILRVGQAVARPGRCLVETSEGNLDPTSTSVVHIAAQILTFEGRSQQRCGWCGESLNLSPSKSMSQQGFAASGSRAYQEMRASVV
jgi:hypothetical protein